MAVESVDPARCGSYKLHGEHHWYSGWFWSNRNYCPGSNSDNFPGDREPIPFPDEHESEETTLIPLVIFEHKHDFKLAKGLPTPGGQFLRKPKKDILWVCDWHDCDENFIIKRKLWKKQGAPYDVY